jgi:glucose-1-phosphate thymidylyltransferase
MRQQNRGEYSNMKGIIMAGGTGTRLWPMTLTVSKQLLPVFDKPMVYYPLATLISAGIKDILIISTPHDIPLYQSLLKDGSQWGVSLSYKIQDRPGGIAQAFIVGKEFIGDDNVTLILGDNIFYGPDITRSLERAIAKTKGASIFAYFVKDPNRYGVVSFDKNAQAIDIEEKPKNPKSSYAVTGLYCYDNDVVKISQNLSPSNRGELEITDVNNYYLSKGLLNVEVLSRGVAWLDTGTPESLLDASHFIQTLQERQSIKVGCPEEAAWRAGFITDSELEVEANKFLNSGYGQYLLDLLTHQQFLMRREK